MLIGLVMLVGMPSPPDTRSQHPGVCVHKWTGLARTRDRSQCVRLNLYVDIGGNKCRESEKWPPEQNEKEQREKKVETFLRYWIRYECAAQSLLMGTHGGPGRETGRRLAHARTHALTHRYAQRLYYPQAEHHELQGYTSMLIGWGV